MAEGAPLLREYGLIAHRGFESLPLRQLKTGPTGPLLIGAVGGYRAPSRVRQNGRTAILVARSAPPAAHCAAEVVVQDVPRTIPPSLSPAMSEWRWREDKGVQRGDAEILVWERPGRAGFSRGRPAAIGESREPNEIAARRPPG